MSKFKFVLVLILLSGCAHRDFNKPRPGSEVALGNFDQIRFDMSPFEIEKILGVPGEKLEVKRDGQRLNYWLYSRYTQLDNSVPYVTVAFDSNNKLVGKSIESDLEKMSLETITSRYRVSDFKLMPVINDCSGHTKGRGHNTYYSVKSRILVVTSLEGRIDVISFNRDFDRRPASYEPQRVCRIGK